MRFFRRARREDGTQPAEGDESQSIEEIEESPEYRAAQEIVDHAPPPSPSADGSVDLLAPAPPTIVEVPGADESEESES